MTGKKPTMAVIRGIRHPEGIFYNAFKNIDVRFIYVTQKSVKYPIRLDRLKLVNLKYEKRYFIDPVTYLNNHETNHHSWVQIKDLEENLKDVDVINTSDLFYVWSAQIADLAGKLKKRLVTVVWETISYHPSVYVPPYCLSVKKMAKNTDLFILRSRKVKEYAKSLHLPDKKVKVIYKGIDLDLFNVKDFNKKPDGRVKILYTGQFIKSKGLDDLLEAFINLSREKNNVELLLAGSGPLNEKIKNLAKSYPIKNLGFVEYSKLPEIYREADIYCSPSKDLRYFGIKVWEELFSYTLIEAQASGLPIVATICGAISEEVGSKNLLVEQGNAEALSKALKMLVENPDLRVDLGKSNRKRAEKLFDLNKQAKVTEEAILSILN